MADIIRKATERDLSRIAEILVFSKRINYRSIFHNDDYSFGELQVANVMRAYEAHPDRLEKVWVYDDGLVKGLIQIGGKEIETLYVEPFFTSDGIGAQLMQFAISRFDADTLWVLEKNPRAQKFYQKHGFTFTGEKTHEPETPEYLLRMSRG